MYITNSFYKIEFKKMEITNNNSIISNGEDSRKIVLPVNVKNRYKAYTTEEWVTLAKDDLYFTNKEDLKNMIEGWDNQLEKQ